PMPSSLGRHGRRRRKSGPKKSVPPWGTGRYTWRREERPLSALFGSWPALLPATRLYGSPSREFSGSTAKSREIQQLRTFSQDSAAFIYADLPAGRQLPQALADRRTDGSGQVQGSFTWDHRQGNEAVGVAFQKLRGESHR